MIWTIITCITIALVGVYVAMWSTGLLANKDSKNGVATQPTPSTGIRAWFGSHKEVAQTLLLVTIGIATINILCYKLGFIGWQRLYSHDAFWTLNGSILLAIFLTLVAKKTVVKWFVGLIVCIILFGGGRIWWGYSNPNNQSQSNTVTSVDHTIVRGEETPVILFADVVSRDRVPVEIRFNKPGSMTRFGEWQKVEEGITFPYPITFIQYRALTDTFTVTVRARDGRS